jgi:hypothetical protein
VLEDLDRTLTALLARALELDPALSREAASRRVAHLARDPGSDGLHQRLLRLASEFRQRGVINPYRLFEDDIRPHFFLSNGRPGLLDQIIRDSARARDGISQYVVFGHWDSLLILFGSNDEAAQLLERLQEGAYEDSVRFVAEDVLLAYRHRIRPEYSLARDVKAEEINDLALDYENDAKRELRDALIEANVLVGPTLTLDSQSPYPITAFVGVLVRTRAPISGQEVLNTFMRQEDLQRCLVDLYQINHGVPYHYFAKIECATFDELDGATSAVAFASSGGIRFEGETLVVAQGSEQLPLLRKADVASLTVAPDISSITRRAQQVFDNLGAQERVAFNALADERQLATLRALAGLQSIIDGKVFDAQTQQRIESAFATFARESTRSDSGPNLTGAVIEITSMVEILAKTFLSRLAYAACGKDSGRIQLELKLPSAKIRSLSLGKVVQALRIAAKSDVFSRVHDVPDEWVDRLDAFADERNSWAHGAAQGTDAHLVDQAFLAMREGIVIASWLAGELDSITNRRDPRMRTRADSHAGTPVVRLASRSGITEFNVFVSHAAIDGPIAERLAMGLQAMGYNSWYAEWELKAGDSIVTKIQAALSACDVLIVVLSHRSVASRWVNRELNSVLMAQLGGQQVLVIPVLIDSCKIPSLIADTLHVDMRGDFESGFLKILDAIRSHRNRIALQPLAGDPEGEQ